MLSRARREAAARRKRVKKAVRLSKEEIHAIMKELQNPAKDLVAWRTIVNRNYVQGWVFQTDFS